MSAGGSGPAPPALGLVLAGGESRRMGRPKAFLPGPDGRPLLQVALDALGAAGATRLAIAARDPADFAGWPLPVVRDRAPGLGPLAGIEAALREAPLLLSGPDRPSPEAWVLVVACDMPWLDPALLRELLARAHSGRPGLQAVVPRVEGRAEPLHAAWHTSALPAVQAALDAGRLAVHEVLRGLRVEWVELGSRPSLRSVNVPGDLSW